MKRFIFLMVLILLVGCGKSNPTEVSEMSNPARWCHSPVIVEPTPAGARGINTINRVGCFQKQALEDSDGYTYVVVAEDNKAGATLRIAVYKSTQPNKTFTGNVSDYAFQADTTIANGYDTNSILNLREFSADLRGSHIFITFIYNAGAGNYSCELVDYNIINTTFSLQVRADLDGIGNLHKQALALSCDIALQQNNGAGMGFISFLDTTHLNVTTTPRTDIARFTEFMVGAGDISLWNQGMGRDIFGAINFTGGLMSCFDGGNEFYPLRSFELNHYLISGIPQNLLPVYNGVISLFEYQIPWKDCSGAIDVGNVLYNFGCWDACYIDAFNCQVMAKWLRNAGGTGWDLYVGFRNQNGFVAVYKCLSVDYANLGVADIETELENIGIFPECVLSTDETGRIFVYALYPSLQNQPLGSASPGALDDDPYTCIDLFSFIGGGIYAPSNIDKQTVFDPYAPGVSNHKSLRFLSAPHRTDSQDLAMADEVLWFTVNDRLPIGADTRNSQLIFFRN